MTTKKILILGPVSAAALDNKSIVAALDFLKPEYELEYVDSLLFMNHVDNESYYLLWQDWLRPRIADYDVFLGFSFGGVILQQCFSLFTDVKKPVILFSTPTFSDTCLLQKLGDVIVLCQQERLEEALVSLYQHVFDSKLSLKVTPPDNRTLALKRLIFGLQRVLDTNSVAVVQQSLLQHWHFIGEQSRLVNADNVLTPLSGHLIVVPEAGMRVLEDNPLFCKSIILEILRS